MNVNCILYEFLFIFISLEGSGVRGGGGWRDRISIFWLIPRFLQQLGLDQTGARSLELHQSQSHMWVPEAPALEHHLPPCQGAHQLGVGPEVEELASEPSTSTWRAGIHTASHVSCRMGRSDPTEIETLRKTLKNLRG